jgi:hypothetical protein
MIVENKIVIMGGTTNDISINSILFQSNRYEQYIYNQIQKHAWVDSYEFCYELSPGMKQLLLVIVFIFKQTK